MLHVTFYYWRWHKIKFNHTNSQSILRDTRAAFSLLPAITHLRSEDWCYFGNLFSTCQQVLGHACHIWYSFGLKSLTHNNNSTCAGPVRIHCVMTGMFDRKWKGCTSVSKYWDFFYWILKIFANFDHWLKRMTCWCAISLRSCHIMAIHTCYALYKTKKSFIAHPWCLQSVVGLECIHWGWSAAIARWGGEVRDSYLAWVRPVHHTMLWYFTSVAAKCHPTPYGDRAGSTIAQHWLW